MFPSVPMQKCTEQPAIGEAKKHILIYILTLLSCQVGILSTGRTPSLRWIDFFLSYTKKTLPVILKFLPATFKEVF